MAPLGEIIKQYLNIFMFECLFLRFFLRRSEFFWEELKLEMLDFRDSGEDLLFQLFFQLGVFEVA